MNRIGKRVCVGIVAVAATGCVIIACSPKEASVPSYYEVRLEVTSREPAGCDYHVGVEFAPVDVPAVPAGSLYETTDYLDQAQVIGTPVEDGPGNWECWQSIRSHDLAPGRWRITVEFPNGAQHCERDVAAGKLGKVRMDEEEGCVEFDRPGTEVDARKSARTS